MAIEPLKPLTPRSLSQACDSLAKSHSAIARIVSTYGKPPLYNRDFGFGTLVQIILEQQVSLASGRAVFERLSRGVGTLTPEALLPFNAEGLRAFSVSRQKAGYLLHLSHCVASGALRLDVIPGLPDDEVRRQLMQVKGIGPWTADVVLMLCLRRPDVFPVGDLALVNSVRTIHRKPGWTTDDVARMAQRYAPYRTVAAYCYWHAYLSQKAKMPVVA